jgi:hypothetical protein
VTAACIAKTDNNQTVESKRAGEQSPAPSHCAPGIGNDLAVKFRILIAIATLILQSEKAETAR